MNTINKNTLILLDFDGTIMKTDVFNWECYNIILKKYDKEISFKDFLESILNSNLEYYFKEKLGFTEEEIKIIRNDKYDLMYTQINKTESIKFIEGMEDLIIKIYEEKIPHCVVTNTSIKIISLYKKYYPILNKLENWITREDYKLPKPNSECYKLAIERYGETNNKIIGFEDSWVGYQALKGIVEEINIIMNDYKINYDKFLIEKVNLIENYNLY